MTNKPVFDYPLFAMGFRLFFALAGLSALALIAAWTSIFDGSLHTDNYFPANLWHAHEMLLGYTTAVIAGFLLTAIRNWTGLPTSHYDQLAGLGLLWLYGRVLAFYSNLLPDLLIAAVDFAFLPTLAYLLSKPLLQSGNHRNLIFIAMLLTMAVGNGLIHAQILGAGETAALGFNLVLTVIMGMILVMAGRVFPFFTERGLSGVICIRNPLLDNAAIASSLLVFLLLLANIDGAVLLLATLAAVVANSLRVLDWYNPRIWYVPLLWVLYVGYAWLILGFGLLGLSAYGWLPQALALHAFTVGGIGILTLGMMARVALGHTGRALRASNIMALAFVLLNLAALFRVLFAALLPGWYNGFLLASTYCWLAAFSLFVFYYLPILTTARVDGQPG